MGGAALRWHLAVSRNTAKETGRGWWWVTSGGGGGVTKPTQLLRRGGGVGRGALGRSGLVRYLILPGVGDEQCREELPGGGCPARLCAWSRPRVSDSPHATVMTACSAGKGAEGRRRRGDSFTSELKRCGSGSPPRAGVELAVVFGMGRRVHPHDANIRRGYDDATRYASPRSSQRSLLAEFVCQWYSPPAELLVDLGTTPPATPSPGGGLDPVRLCRYRALAGPSAALTSARQ